MVNANEFVASSCNMEVRLFLVHEESIRNPNVSYKLRSNGKRLNSGSLLISQPRVGPKLTEIEVQGEILKNIDYEIK